MKRLMLWAAAGSVALLVGAFFFQALGWAPCKMCLWQRWPHAAAGVIGLAVLLTGSRWLSVPGALAALIAAGIAAYHSGVERKWWEGPASCTGSGEGLTGLSADALLPGAGGPTLVLCDTFTPFFAGLTMANWNFIISLGLAALWITALRQPQRNTPPL